MDKEIEEEEKDLPQLDDNTLFRILLRKLEASTSIIDVGTKQSAKVTDNGELMVAINTPDIQNIDTYKWNAVVPSIIPEGMQYFIYIKNNGTGIIRLSDFKFKPTIDGVNTTNILFDRVIGIPEFKNESIINTTNINATQLKPDTYISMAESILNLETIGTVGILGMGDKYRFVEFEGHIELLPDEAIALKWTESSGALFGTFKITENSDGS